MAYVKIGTLTELSGEYTADYISILEKEISLKEDSEALDAAVTLVIFILSSLLILEQLIIIILLGKKYFANWIEGEERIEVKTTLWRQS